MLNKIFGSDEQLRDMYEQKRMRMSEIAAVYGCGVPAVSMRLKKIGIKTRRPPDYEATDKMRENCRALGRKRKGATMSDASKALVSMANKGRRKRKDYEFGGHEKYRNDGYVKVYVPDHPNCTADGYVMKHVLVMERHIGRYLVAGEVVHHENHIRDDNRIENLRLMTASEHMSMHMKERHARRVKHVT